MSFPRKLFPGFDARDKSHGVNQNAKFKTIQDVSSAIRDDTVDAYMRDSPLGVVVRFAKSNFKWCSSVVHYAIVNQLECNKKNEIWSLLGGKPARFSICEFAKITGLKCVPIQDDEEADTDHTELERFINLLDLPKKDSRSPSCDDILSLCSGSRSESIREWARDDKIRLYYLAILAGGFLEIDRRTAIPQILVEMVMDLEKFEHYPWGWESFKGLMRSVKSVDEKRLSQKSYTVNGFVQVLQIWVYMAVPKLGRCLGNRIPNPLQPGTPPLLMFKGKVATTIDIVLREVSDDQVKVKAMLDPPDEQVLSFWEHGRQHYSPEDKAVDTLMNYILDDSKSRDDINWLGIYPEEKTVTETPLITVGGECQKESTTLENEKIKGTTRNSKGEKKER